MDSDREEFHEVSSDTASITSMIKPVVETQEAKVSTILKGRVVSFKDFDGITCLPALIRYTSAKYPQRVAISFEALSEEGIMKELTYTYEDMVTAVERLARKIKQRLHSEQENAVVGILFSKSIELTLIVLAVTFAGATWLPFDPDTPAERIDICIQNSGASLLLHDFEHSQVAAALCEKSGGYEVLSYSDVESLQEDSSVVLQLPTPETPAYYIYTSGTTGTPKGISIHHGAVAKWAVSESYELGLNSTDIVWNGFSPAFDMWLEETFCSFSRGCHVAIARSGQWQDIKGLSEAWARRKITVITAVPTLLAMVLMEGSLDSIPKTNFGGEACTNSLASKLHRDGLQLFNTYGPSETTVTATMFKVLPDAPIRIGKPLPGYEIAILQEDSEIPVLLPLKSGTTGELAIGGPCVGQGYVKRPDLTVLKFVPNPLQPSEILYRTGDLVSIDENFDINFIGRIDTQVKHRGFRIELSEIEQKINEFPAVLTVAVILSPEIAISGNKQNSARLEAYIVFEVGTSMNIAGLRRFLTSSLMPYMVPEEFIQLASNEMPRLLSGKINKKALVEHSVKNRRHKVDSSLTSSFRMNLSTNPNMALEEIIIGVLKGVFKTKMSISATSDFFNDLGGHSILAAKFVSRMRKGLDNVPFNPFTTIGLIDVFKLRTAEKIAKKFSVEQDSTSFKKISTENLKSGDSSKNILESQSTFHTVPQLRFLLCGLVQLPLLYFIYLFYSVGSIGLYLVFFPVYEMYNNIYIAFLVMYLYDSMIVPFYALLGIVIKWTLLGKLKEGDYPLWGSFYIRWWFVGRVLNLVKSHRFGDSKLLVFWLRLLGAKIGKHVHIGPFASIVAADLLEIEDGVTFGMNVICEVESISNGMLRLRKVKVHSNASIGTEVTLEGKVEVGAGTEIKCMSGVPYGTRIPSNEVWNGSPASFECVAKEWNVVPPTDFQVTLITFFHAMMILFVTPITDIFPHIPLILIFVFVNHQDALGYGLLIPSIGIQYVLLEIFILIFCKWVILGKVKEGKYSTASFFYLRKWFVDDLVEGSLVKIHSMYATLYIQPFLRGLGMKIGPNSEISTISHANHDLLEVGTDCFLADYVLFDDYLRGYELNLQKTVIQNGSFVGNAALIPANTVVPEDVLIGVFSVPPSNNAAFLPGLTYFGLPPIVLTNRSKTDDFDESKLDATFLRLITRLLIELVRIFFPSIIVTYSVIFAIDLVLFQNEENFGIQILVLPVYHFCLFVMPILAITLLLKWILVGKYKKSNWPMWSYKVWLSEFVTSVMEAFSPIIFDPFIGTPYIAFFLRFYGAHIGKRVYFGSVFMSEFDCLHIGDDAALNMNSFPQTHLFEDKIMKVRDSKLGNQCTMKSKCTILPGAEVQDLSILGSNSVVMQGEVLSGGCEWRGFPVGRQ